MRRLATLLIALAVAPAAAQPDVIPELRVLIVPAEPAGDLPVLAELAAAAHFNTLLVTFRQRREAVDYQIPHELLDAAERWGLDVQCHLVRLVSGDPEENARLAGEHLQGLRQIARDHTLDALVIDASGQTPRGDVAALAEEMPRLPLLAMSTFSPDPRNATLGARGEALTWADLGLIDAMIVVQNCK